jgi:lipoprotein LprG
MSRITLLLVVATLLSACAGGAPAATPQPTPTPAELVARSGQAIQASQSFQFAIELTGKSVYTDSSRLFALRSMSGGVKRPDGAIAALKVRGAIGVAEIRTVSLAGKQYFTNPITRNWQCLEPGAAFDPSVLFDPQRGVGALLEQGVEQPELVGEEQLDGQPVLHLRGMLAAERLQAISVGLLGAGPVAIDLWANQATSRPIKLVLVDTATDPQEPSTWTMMLTGYDQEVDVRAPAEC